MSGQRNRRWPISFCLGNELEIMTRHVQDAAGRMVGNRNGHAAFAGDQADVANWGVAKIAGKMPEIGGNAASRPIAENAILWPEIARIEGAGAPDNSFQLSGPFRVFAVKLARQ